MDMGRRAYVVIGVVSVVLAGTKAQAQQIDAGCAKSFGAVQDACQKTVDLFQLMAPQLATAVTAGNATLGEAGTLGGLGHFTIEARGNVVRGAVPFVNNATLATVGAEQTNFKTSSVAIPAAFVDGGVGLFKGFGVGLTHIGGLDVLGSAFYAPNYTGHGITVRPDRGIELGYGGRLGIVDETAVSPAISVTFMERDLPTTQITGVDNDGDSLRVSNLSVKTSAWRAVIGKHFLIVGLSAGVGQDHEKSSTDIEASGGILGLITASALATPSQSLTRTNYFGDLSFDPPLVHLIFEVGGVSAREIATYNTYSGVHAGDALLYGSVGVRLKI
jgi:hypothetical protein